MGWLLFVWSVANLAWFWPNPWLVAFHAVCLGVVMTLMLTDE